MATFKDNQVFYLDVVETDQPVRVVSRVGSGLPAYCTAAGKVHLAAMSEDEIDALLGQRPLRSYTDATITDLATLKKELMDVAAQGFALDNEELDLGVRCIAVPIRDYTRRIVGAISVSGPTMRMSDARFDTEITPMIRQAGKELSARLGYNG